MILIYVIQKFQGVVYIANNINGYILQNSYTKNPCDRCRDRIWQPCDPKRGFSRFRGWMDGNIKNNKVKVQKRKVKYVYGFRKIVGIVLKITVSKRFFF